jgi:hypothetical protein
MPCIAPRGFGSRLALHGPEREQPYLSTPGRHDIHEEREKYIGTKGQEKSVKLNAGFYAGQTQQTTKKP